MQGPTSCHTALESPLACDAPRPTPWHASRAASPPHALHVRTHDKAPEAQTGREAGTPPQATQREPQEERIAPPDTFSPREARPDTPSSWTPSLGVHRPRRRDIPRGRGAPSSRRPRLEGASPLPLLAARPARALPPTRVVRRRYRASALVHGASAAPASSTCARLGHERGSGQRPAKSRAFSYENFNGHCSCDCWPHNWPLS